jgi:uncharacterized protein (DUF1786 family)
VEKEQEAPLTRNILAVDVGGGTQDILLWNTEALLENAYKMVMPSPTVLVAQEIASHTRKNEAVCLVGRTMGGGASSGAVRRHLAGGHKVYALEEAALSIHDNLEWVRQMGVEIVDAPPSGVAEVCFQDLDVERLRRAFALFGVAFPETVAVAVQDHGFSPTVSNRMERFRYWKELLESGGGLRDWALQSPPAYMTRMRAVQRSRPGTVVLDTGLAAMLGALLDPVAKQWLRDGLTVVNIGNVHTVAALTVEDRVYGLYEHHTGLLTGEQLSRDLVALRSRRLTCEQVFDADGHGCAYADRIPEHAAFHRLLVTGPQRRRFQLPDQVPAAPFGDMMLSGCFGLVQAVCWQNRWSVASLD